MNGNKRGIPSFPRVGKRQIVISLPPNDKNDSDDQNNQDDQDYNSYYYN